MNICWVKENVKFTQREDPYDIGAVSVDIVVEVSVVGEGEVNCVSPVNTCNIFTTVQVVIITHVDIANNAL